MNNEDILVGIDVGTTAVKVACYTLAGSCVFSQSVAYEKARSHHLGWSTQDPARWLAAIHAIVAEVSIPTHRIAAIGITSQVNTHVFVDHTGESLMPAISWQDQRCADAAAAVDARIDADMRRKLWGADFVVDASNLLSRAEWVRANRPDVWTKTAWIMSPKDYCLYALTGEAVADPISSIGLVGPDGVYLGEAIDLVDELADKMPPLKGATEYVGQTRPNFRWPDRPVAVGIMDAWASLYGSGAVEHGNAIQVSGTSEIIAAVSNEQHSAAGVIAFPPIPGWYLHAGPTQLGGDAANWFAELIGASIPEFFELAAQRGNSAEPIIFLPHIMGERAPLWDSRAKGMFTGITRNHTKSDLAYSVLEGVAHAARLLLSQVEQSAGYPISTLRLSGGAARSDLWCQIKANVMNRQLDRLANHDTGTFGAALVAGVSQGCYNSLEEAGSEAVAVDRSFEPDAKEQDRCELMHSGYTACYKAISAVNHRLHDFAHASRGETT